ncbi:GAF domain-containing protein [Oculatella sp. LEGE 06141]|uniref:GAF domain-containing protein n=1 Tax=Oculatella sp. LEGE 06141 TaxID=1828648 RepID=UPI00187EEF7B|nr:GAF domain-containing protein [Oculatella sp. LEGE 06141]MBE9182146.1 GAF domain-containing protein [Oculatella sp. LEGE 06141]
MTAFYPSELILEEFADFFTETPVNGQSNGKSESLSQVQLEQTTSGYSNGNAQSATNVHSNGSAQSTTTVHGNGKVSSNELSPEIQQIVAALVGLKTELKQAGLLKKSNVQNLFLQVAEFVVAQHKRPEGVSSASSQQLQRQWQQLLAIAAHMRQATDLKALLDIAVTAACQILQVDRVLVYRFDLGDTGRVIAESLQRGWTPAIREALPMSCFGADQAEDYVKKQALAIEDIHKINLTPHQQQVLEQLQVKSSLSLPILIGSQVWGLMVVHQCNKIRRWQEAEINLLYQIVIELTLNLQASEFQLQLQQQVAQEKAVAKVIEKIRQSLDVDTIFKTTVQEVRQLLKADRVALYQFSADWGGEFVADSVAHGWTGVIGTQINDTCLMETQGGRYRQNVSFAVSDIYTCGYAPCHIEILEGLEAKAYMMAPVFKGNKLWGLLAAYQNSGPRQWKESEQDLLTQIGVQFGVALQQAELILQTQQQANRERLISKIADRMRQSLDFDTILRTTTQEVRQLLRADRVAVYRFNPDWSGEFIAESVAAGWVRLVGPDIKTVWEDTHLQETQGGRYRHNETFAVDDIYQAGHFQCHVDVLEQFEVKAYVIVPVFTGQKLWGLMGVYQNSGPRHWQESEVSLIAQIGAQLGLPVQQAELLNRTRLQADRERSIAKVFENVRQSLDLDTIFKTATQEVRQLLKTDRIALYRFNPDWSGQFIAESVGANWVKLVGPDVKTVWEDTHLQETQGGRYRKNETFVVNDIYRVGHSPCHVEVLEQFEAKAYMLAPVFIGQNLWGILGAYQNSGPRYWEESEVSLLAQVGTQLGVALQQAELLLQIQQQAEGERTLSRVSDRIRQSLDVNSIFKAATQEIRQVLKTDRVAVYRFNPDWSGDFVAESVTTGWGKLVGTDIGTNVKDTHLQETQGGRYRKNEVLAVDDIYKAGHAPCHVEILERFEAKAYVLVPVLMGQRLWGLLCAYQNSEPRHWEDGEIVLLKQLGVQLGVALQQAETLEQLRIQSEQLAQAASRDKEAKEQLQQRVIQLLVAVKPVFSGDLTVRVPITEDEVGTIADAYNNTIQSLRKIVMQVQSATVKVTQTSRSSGTAIADLSQQAQQQLNEVTQALNQVQAMVNSTQSVATNAQQVEAAVQQANQTVRQGDTAMNRTVDGIQAIRETVAETSKKIKRLSESSQKISKVVSLISNFTTQTQLLALNASIEATRAGEYGRGFSVVADEVRSLSRQSADATREIEKLVQEIQTETIAVSTAMDQGIQQVVGGTNLVNETRQQLNAIVAATAQISQLVQGITHATETQTQQSQLVKQAMADVAAIANKASANSTEISASFEELLTTAQQLQASVGQFKVN